MKLKKYHKAKKLMIRLKEIDADMRNIRNIIRLSNCLEFRYKSRLYIDRLQNKEKKLLKKFKQL